MQEMQMPLPLNFQKLVGFFCCCCYLQTWKI